MTIYCNHGEAPPEASRSLAPTTARNEAGSKRDFEILIHVGHVKTATTWLQDNVFSNPATGFVVPWADSRVRAIAAFVTVNPYLQEAEWARGFFEKELECLADDPRVPVLSEESLGGDPFPRRYTGRDVADRIHQAFPRARILIGIREQKAMAISCYRQFIHSGGSLTIEDFVGTGHEPLGFTPILQEDYLAYDRVVGYYQALFGKANVLVLPLELLQKDRDGYMKAIYDFCGCPARPDIEADPKHVGWSGITLAVRRKINPLIPTSPLSMGYRQLPNRIAARICNIINRLPRGWSKAIERRWKDVVDRRYNGLFGESNRRLAELTDLDLAALGYQLD